MATDPSASQFAALRSANRPLLRGESESDIFMRTDDSSSMSGSARSSRPGSPASYLGGQRQAHGGGFASPTSSRPSSGKSSSRPSSGNANTRQVRQVLPPPIATGVSTRGGALAHQTRNTASAPTLASAPATTSLQTMQQQPRASLRDSNRSQPLQQTAHLALRKRFPALAEMHRAATAPMSAGAVPTSIQARTPGGKLNIMEQLREEDAEDMPRTAPSRHTMSRTKLRTSTSTLSLSRPTSVVDEIRVLPDFRAEIARTKKLGGPSIPDGSGLIVPPPKPRPSKKTQNDTDKPAFKPSGRSSASALIARDHHTYLAVGADYHPIEPPMIKERTMTHLWHSGPFLASGKAEASANITSKVFLNSPDEQALADERALVRQKTLLHLSRSMRQMPTFEPM